MEVTALATEVERIVSDSFYNQAWAVTKFNDCLNSIATKCRIPALQVSHPLTVTAGTVVATVPKTYLHELYLATSVTYPHGLLLAPNLQEMIRSSHPDDTGNPAMICIEGSLVHFRPKPSENEIITLYYYGKPRELALGDEFPTYIPDMLQDKIFVNYALTEAYLQIEDGIDGANPNTGKYGGLAAGYLASLIQFYPYAPKARPDVKRSRSEF